MFWKSKPVFEWQENEVKDVTVKRIDALAKMLGQQVYITESGLVTADEVRRMLVKELESRTEPITLFSLASDLSIESKDIEVELEGLRRDYSNQVWFGYHILPGPLVKQLKGKLRESAAQHTTKLDFCKTHNITLQQLDWLLSMESTLKVLDGSIYYLSEVEERLNGLKQVFEAATERVDIHKAEPSEEIRQEVWSKLRQSGSANGQYDSLSGIYTPDVYYKERRELLMSNLKENFYVTVEDLKYAGFNDSAKFAEREDCKQIGNLIVSRSKLKFVRTVLDSTYKKQGWISLAELGLTSQVVKAEFTDLRKPQVLESLGECFISRKLENMVLETALQIVAASAKERFNPEKPDEQLDPPSNHEIANAVSQEKQDLPAPLCLELVSAQSVAIRTRFFAEIKTLQESAQESERIKREAKAAAYLQAIESFDDEFKGKLYEKWARYAAEQNLYYHSEMSKSVEYYRNACTKEAVVDATESLNQKNLAKLKKTSDASLVLHLALVTWHSQNNLDNYGQLKISGKLIPAVMDVVEFPPQFQDLRQKVAKSKKFTPEEIKESANAVKALFS